MSRVKCDYCGGHFVECSHKVIDMKTLETKVFCSPKCAKNDLGKELEKWAKEKE